MSKRVRQRQHGFTLIEVMTALAVMTVGIMAIVGFQRQSARSTRHARNVATATQIAENWIERLKVDALNWNQVGNRQDPTRADEPVILANTQWLSQIAGSAGQWRQILIDPTVGTGTPGVWNGFDLDGADLQPTGGGTHRFCASYRFSWVFYGQSLRADVRVWWAKESANPGLVGTFPTCNDNNAWLSPGPGGIEVDNYHIVYLSSVLRVNNG